MHEIGLRQAMLTFSTPADICVHQPARCQFPERQESGVVLGRSVKSLLACGVSVLLAPRLEDNSRLASCIYVNHVLNDSVIELQSCSR